MDETAEDRDIKVGVLGPLEVREGTRAVALRGAKQRKLFARLAVDRNRVVSVDSLVETLWPDRVPSDPAHQVQVYVSEIRKALGRGAAALETAPPGYRLRTDPEDVDLDQFEILCAEARSAVAEGDFVRAVDLCDRALALWRGPFMQDFEGDDFAYTESVRAQALRSQVEIDRLTALLGTGSARSLLPELEARVAADPTDERYVLLLMQGLHQQGRQADAIDAFHRLRTALAEQLGIDPAPEVQDLFAKVLRGDPPSRYESSSSDLNALGSVSAADLLSRASRSRAVIIGVLIALLISVSAAAVLTRGPFQDEIASLTPNSLSVIDHESGRIVANLTLPVRPTRVAFGFGALWITSASSGQLLRVDPETLAIRQEIDVDTGVGPIAFADSAVWVANVDDGTVTRIDPETNDRVQTVTVGNGPSDIEAAASHLWISNRLDASVAKFDARRGEVVKRIAIGLSPGGLAATDDSLWVSDEASGTVARVDLASDSVVSIIHVGNGPGPLTADENDVWVVNRADETVSRIGRSGSVEATVIFEHDLSSIHEIDGVAWVAHQGGVERVDPDRSVSGELVASGAATDLAFGAGRVWVTSEPSSAEHSGGTVTLLNGPIDSLDPAKAYDPNSWRVLDVLNDGLVAYAGPDSRSILANLALRVPTPSDGGRTYTFQLRENISYSNGEEVRPADVRHSFERLLGNGFPVGELFSSIAGAGSCLKKSDDCDLSSGIVTSAASRTVTFHLAFPDPDFLSKLATPSASIVPSSVPRGIQESVPSTGPFEVVDHDAKRLVLERRDDFEPWDAAAQPRGYVDRIVVDQTQGPEASQAVLAGEADWTALFGEDVAELRRRHGSQIREYPLMAIWAVFLNTNLPPFDDVEVRQAVNLSVDREAVLETFGGSEQARITCQILPPGTQGYEPFCPYTANPDPSGIWSGPDLQRAKRLVRGKARIPVTVYGFDGFEGTAALVAAALRDLGYPARSRTLSTGRFFEMASTGSSMQAGVFAWFADTPGPLGFIAPNFDCNGSRVSNYARHCDPVVDRLSKRAARLQYSDPQHANELWSRVDRRLTQAAPWIPLVNPKGVELVSERLGNYSYSPVTGMILSEVWVK